MVLPWNILIKATLFDANRRLLTSNEQMQEQVGRKSDMLLYLVDVMLA